MSDAEHAENHSDIQDEIEDKPSTWRRRFLGDIPVGAFAGTVRQVPGAGTPKGEKAIAKAMGDVLDRVRRSIRERSTTSPSTRA